MHDLTNAKAEVDRAFSVAQTNLMRFRTTSELVDVLLEKAKNGNIDIFDRLLFAQSNLVNAESNYFLSQVEFEVAMKNVYYERNAILDYYGMSVVDGVGDAPESKAKAPQNLMKSNSGAIVPEPAAPASDTVPDAPIPKPADQKE